MQLGAGFGDLPWFALTLLAGGQVGIGGLLLWSLAAGATTAALLGALRAGRLHTARPVTVRGPVRYAGPGSLGGTSSARRR